MQNDQKASDDYLFVGRAVQAGRSSPDELSEPD